MARKRTRSRSIYAAASTRGLGLGLQSLTELPNRNRSSSYRWWRGQSLLAKLGYWFLVIAVGLGAAFTVLMTVGAALIR